VTIDTNCIAPRPLPAAPNVLCRWQKALEGSIIGYADYTALSTRFGTRAKPQPSFSDPPPGELLM
jgi:hypothetical protein